MENIPTLVAEAVVGTVLWVAELVVGDVHDMDGDSAQLVRDSALNFAQHALSVLEDHGEVDRNIVSSLASFYALEVTGVGTTYSFPQSADDLRYLVTDLHPYPWSLVNNQGVISVAN